MPRHLPLRTQSYPTQHTDIRGSYRGKCAGACRYHGSNPCDLCSHKLCSFASSLISRSYPPRSPGNPVIAASSPCTFHLWTRIQKCHGAFVDTDREVLTFDMLFRIAFPKVSIGCFHRFLGMLHCLFVRSKEFLIRLEIVISLVS